MGGFAVLTLLALTLPDQAPPPPPPPPTYSLDRVMPVCEAYWKTPVIFSGEVLDIVEPINPSGARYPRESRVIFRVERAWRGDVAGEVAVHSVLKPAPEGFEFRRGEKYLVYPAPFSSRLTVAGASRTRLLSEASDDLEYFGRTGRSSSAGKVTGTVMFDGDEPRAAVGYRVRLGNLEGERAVQTGDGGTFEFSGVPPGRYGIALDLSPPLRARGPVSIELPDAHGCAEARFLIVAMGSIEFFALDSAGKPVVRTTFELIDVDSLSQDRPKVFRGKTYADGSVGWGQVRAGRYIIGLNATLMPDPRQPQPTLFYPGVRDIASAFVLEVGAGEDVRLDTLRLPAPPAQLPVTGTVLAADGRPVRAADVVLRSAAKLSKGRQVGRKVKTDAEGGFSIPAVAGYRYSVEVSLSVEGTNPRLFAISDEFELSAKTRPLRIVREKK
jgi:hypothetical protein